MEVQAILPILIPGVIMQVAIQAYYIKHAWENNDLSVQEKISYIVAIVLFNVIAAAIYLFSTRKKSSVRVDALEEPKIDDQIRQGIFALLIVAFEIFSLRIIVQNMTNPRYPLIAALLGACFLIMIVHGFLIKKQSLLFYLLPALQLLVIIQVEYLDQTQNTPLIVLVVVAGMINKLPAQTVKIYSIFAFLLYFIVITVKAQLLFGPIRVDSDDAVSYIYVNMLVFTLVYAVLYSLNKQLLANDRLETALQTLQEQSLQLQEMSAIAERNRITGEIHDTVGHMLTSAVISIEAGQKLLTHDFPAAQDKFSLAKNQVKQGLDDIRHSIKTIQTGGETSFNVKLNNLIKEIHRNTGLIIREIVHLNVDLHPIQQRVLLLAVTECSTNSLKHGESTEADLLLQRYKDTVHFTFSDNGKGTNAVSFGFGLQQMAQRVESLGGTFAVDSVIGEGFTVAICIPLGQKTGGNTNGHY